MYKREVLKVLVFFLFFCSVDLFSVLPAFQFSFVAYILHFMGVLFTIIIVIMNNVIYTDVMHRSFPFRLLLFLFSRSSNYGFNEKSISHV